MVLVWGAAVQGAISRHGQAFERNGVKPAAGAWWLRTMGCWRGVAPWAAFLMQWRGYGGDAVYGGWMSENGDGAVRAVQVLVWCNL
jgi:hypothetical protein